MGGELNGQHENNSPKDGESNNKHENNSPKGCTVQKITRQRDGWVESKMVSTKITRQRLENQIISTKITRPRVAQYKKITRQRDGWAES